MSNDFRQFTNDLGTDPTVRSRLENATSKEQYVETILQVGKEKGYDFRKEDVTAALDKGGPQGGAEKLSDEHLEGVAGGGLGSFLERWYYERYTSGYRACR